MALGMLAAPMAAEGQHQEDGQRRYGGVADRFTVRGGVLFSEHGTVARVDSETLGIGTLVDLENDLGLARETRNARVDGHLRLGRRHQIRGGYIRLDRGASSQLQRQIQWGDEVFNIDTGVTSSVDLTLIPVNYRFALIKSDRIDLGLSAGVFAMFAKANLAAPAVSIDESEALDFPLPVFGGDVEIAVAPRLFLIAGGEYFGVSIQDVSGSWREFRGAIEYFPIPNVGIGAAYRYVRLEVDGTDALGDSALGTEIFFDYEVTGPQAYVALAF